MRTYFRFAPLSTLVAAGALLSASCEAVLGADFDDYAREITDGSPYDDRGPDPSDAPRGGAGGAAGADSGPRGVDDGGGMETGDAAVGDPAMDVADAGDARRSTDARGSADTVDVEDAIAPNDGEAGDPSPPDGSSRDASRDLGIDTTAPSDGGPRDGSYADAITDADADLGTPPPRDASTGASCIPNEVRSIGACGNCGMFLQVCNAQGVWDPPYCRQEPTSCAPGSIERRACQAGGTQVATCTASCTWTLGDCIAPICTAGQTEIVSCGMCGTQRRACAATDSGMSWGPFSACANQGVCAAGTREVATCGRCGTRSRLCLATCAWGPFSLCEGERECVPGATETRLCAIPPFGLLGKQTRRCNEACGWGAYDTCR